jgi:hypothetical protein
MTSLRIIDDFRDYVITLSFFHQTYECESLEMADGFSGNLVRTLEPWWLLKSNAIFLVSGTNVTDSQTC